MTALPNAPQNGAWRRFFRVEVDHHQMSSSITDARAENAIFIAGLTQQSMDCIVFERLLEMDHDITVVHTPPPMVGKNRVVHSVLQVLDHTPTTATTRILGECPITSVGASSDRSNAADPRGVSVPIRPEGAGSARSEASAIGHDNMLARAAARNR
jgi:hypothetical protein